MAPAESPAREPMALRLRDVTVSFGGVVALDSISIELGAGQIAAIVGPNGAGKSTMLNAVSRLVALSSGGSIEIYGTSVSSASPSSLAALGVGRSFQNPPLLEDSSVIENVLLGAHHSIGYSLVAQIVLPRRVRSRERAQREAATELLELAGIADLAERKVSALPYGARKLVDIVRAMMAEPRLLLLDEPTSGLDSVEQRHVGDLMLTWMASRHATILMVEHHMDLVRRLANVVYGLVAGSLLAEGEAGAVLESAQFQLGLSGAANQGRPGAVVA